MCMIELEIFCERVKNRAGFKVIAVQFIVIANQAMLGRPPAWHRPIRPIIYIHFILTFILFFAHQVALELCKPLLRLCQLFCILNEY